MIEIICILYKTFIKTNKHTLLKTTGDRMEKRVKAKIGFMAIFIAIVGMITGAMLPAVNVAVDKAEHGGEIGRGIVRDGTRTTYNYPVNQKIYMNDNAFYNFGVLPVLKGQNSTFMVNETGHENPLPNIRVDFGDGEINNSLYFGINFNHTWRKNGTYNMVINIYHDDGYTEVLQYTVVAYDNAAMIAINSTLPMDILNNTAVYIYHEGLDKSIMDYRTQELIDGIPAYEGLRASELNLLTHTIFRDIPSNIVNAPLGINLLAAQFYYMNASKYYAFVYSPACVSPTVYNFSRADLMTGTTPEIHINARDTAKKLTMIYEGNFTKDFNTIYVLPNVVDYEGAPEQRIMWDNYGDYIGTAKLDGIYNATEAAATTGAITRAMLINLTGDDFIPSSFDDAITVDSIAQYVYKDNSVKLEKIEGIGAYNDTANKTFSITLNATYYTSTHINQTVDQHIVGFQIPPDTEYWDRKIIMHFKGWNISHIETNITNTATRGTYNGAEITYNNDTITIDPTETTQGNITVYLTRPLAAIEEGGAVATETTQTIGEKLAEIWANYAGWIIDGIIVIGASYLYMRNKKRRR